MKHVFCKLREPVNLVKSQFGSSSWRKRHLALFFQTKNSKSAINDRQQQKKVYKYIIFGKNYTPLLHHRIHHKN